MTSLEKRIREKVTEKFQNQKWADADFWTPG